MLTYTSAFFAGDLNKLLQRRCEGRGSMWAAAGAWLACGSAAGTLPCRSARLHDSARLPACLQN